MDLMATIASLTDTTAPADRTLDSYDLTPALTGTGASPRGEFFYWTRAKLHAVRVGPYKLHVHQRQPLNYGESRKLETPELYHVEHDVSEQFDIAAQHPEVVAQLLQRFEAHAAGIVPATDQLANSEEP
jgi:uncharacterized sulfatase